MYQTPYTDSTRWLRGNLHGHTCCGRFMDVSESGPMFASLGYDFMAITDHNMAPDQEQWRLWQEQANLVLIPGEENGKTDHFLELGVFSVAETPSLDIEDRAQALMAAGGFIATCHPQEYPHGAENVQRTAGIVHAIEIFNGLREGRGCDEPANIGLWDQALSQGHRVWGVATDDFHCQYTTPGHGWVSVQVPEDEENITWQLLVEQLKKGAFYASTAPVIEQILFDGQNLSLQADRFVQEMRVIGPHGEQLAVGQRPRLEWRAADDLAYFRVEVHTGSRRAWTQPFFLATNK
ncbi:MAG: hypothetical protein GKR89_14465 [Candidatus Latescibacteria bacterium]|nr:hypothetical protein [Candidatus Latescibacterota bacterium]